MLQSEFHLVLKVTNNIFRKYRKNIYICHGDVVCFRRGKNGVF
jgi:hypothetical protein